MYFMKTLFEKILSSLVITFCISFSVAAEMYLDDEGRWVNEAGGNIYGDSRFNIDADPRFNIDADPRFNIDADPRFNIDADPRFNIDADPRFNIDGIYD